MTVQHFVYSSRSGQKCPYKFPMTLDKLTVALFYICIASQYVSVFDSEARSLVCVCISFSMHLVAIRLGTTIISRQIFARCKTFAQPFIPSTFFLPHQILPYLLSFFVCANSIRCAISPLYSSHSFTLFNALHMYKAYVLLPFIQNFFFCIFFLIWNFAWNITLTYFFFVSMVSFETVCSCTRSFCWY